MESISWIKELAKSWPPPEEDSIEYYADKSQLIMLENNGIPTDLIGIEIFIDEVCKEIETNHK